MSTIFGKLFGRKSKKFFSQYGQDKWLYENVFRDKRNGTFLEIGADDGIDKSNTYFFEKNFNWGGLCVEPSPKRFKKLAENRACICENYAIAMEDSELDFLDISGWGKGLSGIVRNYAPEHRLRIEREAQHPEYEGQEIVKVPAISLQKLLDRHGINHVDFCTIDTEGSELEVLKSIDFSVCQIDVLVVENNYQDNSVREFLDGFGFEYRHTLSIDDVYFSNAFRGTKG